MQKVVLKLEKGHNIFPGTLPGIGKHNSAWRVVIQDLGRSMIQKDAKNMNLSYKTVLGVAYYFLMNALTTYFKIDGEMFCCYFWSGGEEGKGKVGF